MSAAVESWFGPAFGQLHPMLQQLHRSGGALSGPITVQFGKGIAGAIGQRLAQRLGLPPSRGTAQLRVCIYSTATELHWDRTFNDASTFASTFTPIGHYPDGYWIETSGALRLDLGVSVVDGGWVWHPRAGRLWGIPIPRGLLPRTSASKHVESGHYRFNVRIALPLLGTVLAYGGNLALTTVSEPLA